MELNSQFQNVICRICLYGDDKIENLFSLIMSNGEIRVIDFIRKITGLMIEESETLPKGICTKCIEYVNSVYKFTELCEESENSLRNQETRRILQKIENEAFEGDSDGKEEFYQEDNFKEDTVDVNISGINPNLEHITNNACNPEIVDADLEPVKISLDNVTKEKYKCSVCFLCFNNKTKFQKHEKTHDSTKPFRCSRCAQTFMKKLHLIVHMRSHIKKEDKKFSCQMCDEQFTYEYLLKQHEYKHTDTKPFPCEKCNKGCLTAESLRRHMKVHDENYVKKTHQCNICKKEFAYPSFLAEHMKNHTGEKPYLCSICGKGFRQTGALHYHQRIHTGYKPFICEICNENFMSQSVLKVHMRKHTNERPYVCDKCGMSFRQSTDLRSHHRIHSGEKPVLCTICGKRMATTGQLTIHVRSHTGERPFPCTVCSRAFTTRTTLMKHSRIHTGDRPYVCDICGHAFNQSSTLKTHANTHKSNKKKEKVSKPKKKNVIRKHFKDLILVKNEHIETEIIAEQFIPEDNIVEVTATELKVL